MTSQAPLNSPYLRSQRQFPQDAQALIVELDKMYIDVAQSMNNRTIGIFPMNRPVVTGESWYLLGENQRQQSLRQVYKITAAGSYPHSLNLADISAFTKIYGTYMNGGNWFPIPSSDLEVTSTNIVVSTITSTSGIVVLEYLANV